MRLIKAKDAAQKLGVDVQTIRNWGESGIIDIIKRPHVHYVNEEQIDALFPELTSTEESKRLLAEEKAHYEEEIKRYKKLKEELHEEYRVGKMINFSIKKAAIYRMFDVVINILVLCKCLNEREATILTSLLKGMPVKEISEKYDISPENASFICQKAIRKASDLKNLEMKFYYLEELEEKISLLENTSEATDRKLIEKEAKESLIKEGDTSETIKDMCSILNTKVDTLGISVRAYNALRMADIETLGDLVRHNKNDVRGFRNMGNKTFSELDDLISDYSLSWGMDVDSYYAAFGAIVKD